MKKRDIFYHTKRKIVFISISIVLLCLFAFAFITQLLYTSRLFNDIDRELLNQKHLIEAAPPEFFEEASRALPDAMFFMKPPAVKPRLIIAIFEDNILKGISPNAFFTVENFLYINGLSEDKIEEAQYKGYNFRGIRYVKGRNEIQMLINVDSELQSIKQLNSAVFMSLIALVMIALALSAFLAARVIRPVREAYDKQAFFIQDASHEMRTPLAVMKGKLEILANSRGAVMDEDFEHISRMMSEIRSLEKLNNDLLYLTKEDMDRSLDVSKFKLHKLIEDVCEFYSDLAEMQNKRFEITRPETEIVVQWDYCKIKRLLVILLENAFKYTPGKAVISLGMEDSGKYILVSVKDNGIGISEEDQKRVFDRFFRSASVRAQNIGGSGIGLSLLKSITNTLGITVRFNSVYGAGTEFILIIPKVLK